MIARKKQMRQLQFAITAQNTFAIFSRSVSSYWNPHLFYSANKLWFVKFRQNRNYFQSQSFSSLQYMELPNEYAGSILGRWVDTRSLGRYSKIRNFAWWFQFVILLARLKNNFILATGKNIKEFESTVDRRNFIKSRYGEVDQYNANWEIFRNGEFIYNYHVFWRGTETSAAPSCQLYSMAVWAATLTWAAAVKWQCRQQGNYRVAHNIIIGLFQLTAKSLAQSWSWLAWSVI